MTQQATITRGAAGEGPAAPCACRGVRWVISPDALRMYVPAMLNGHAAAVSAAELAVLLDGDCIRAVLRLAYGAGERVEHELPLPAGGVTTLRDGVFEHVEAPGVLSMTLRRGDRDVRLVFAHSPLLGAVGLPGGVYDVPELLEISALNLAV